MKSHSKLNAAPCSGPEVLLSHRQTVDPKEFLEQRMVDPSLCLSVVFPRASVVDLVVDPSLCL